MKLSKNNITHAKRFAKRLIMMNEIINENYTKLNIICPFLLRDFKKKLLDARDSADKKCEDETILIFYNRVELEVYKKLYLVN